MMYFDFQTCYCTFNTSFGNNSNFYQFKVGRTCLSAVEQTKAEEPVFLYATVGNGVLTVLKIQNKAPDLQLTPSLELAYIAKSVAWSEFTYYLKYMGVITLKIKKKIVNVSKL